MSLQPLHESKMRFCGVQKLLGGLTVFFSSFPSTWCGFPERSGAGWETSHRSPTTPVAPWQSCSDIWDEDVLSIHPLWSLMVGGDLTVLCSHRRVWLISSLVSCSFLLVLFWIAQKFGALEFYDSQQVPAWLSILQTRYIRLSGVITVVFKLLCRGVSVTQITQSRLDTRWKELSALLTCSIETLLQYSA